MAVAQLPETLQEAAEYFADEARCHEFMVTLRWPDGKVTCPVCNRPDPLWMPSQRRFKCRGKHPRNQFSVKVGTIFEDSPIPLKSWLLAMWQIVNCKNGISSYELARALGVTQKSAWFMNHRIRLAMQGKDGGKLGGEVEVDETYIGGKARNMHKDRRAKALNGKGKDNAWAGKAAVMGLIQRTTKERKSRVRLAVIPSTKRNQLQSRVEKHVEDGATVYTDALQSYSNLGLYYRHQVIDHAECYAKDNVHTNGMENFWCLLKRTIGGTYVSVEPFHLFRYLDEQSFRFNERGGNDGDRFALAMTQIVGRRVDYKTLTGRPHDL
jgi:transposase-like protein